MGVGIADPEAARAVVKGQVKGTGVVIGIEVGRNVGGHEIASIPIEGHHPVLAGVRHGDQLLLGRRLSGQEADTLRVAFRSFDQISYPGDNGLRLVRTSS